MSLEEYIGKQKISSQVPEVLSFDETGKDYPKVWHTKTVTVEELKKMYPKGEKAMNMTEQERDLATGSRPRNQIWDCICQYFGLNPVTKSELARIGKLCRDLKLKSATPEEITRRAKNYAAEWGKDKLTPEALVKHWDRFGVKKKEMEFWPGRT